MMATIAAIMIRNPFFTQLIERAQFDGRIQRRKPVIERTQRNKQCALPAIDLGRQRLAQFEGLVDHRIQRTEHQIFGGKCLYESASGLRRPVQPSFKRRAISNAK